VTEKNDKTPLHPLVPALMLAGAIPFVGCAVGAWRLWALPFDPAYVAVVYGAVILSFLGGIQWGLFLQPKVPKAWVIVSSNGLALLGWMSVLLFSRSPGDICVFQALCFLTALWIDNDLRGKGFLPERFFRLRQLITAIVVPSLLITAAASYVATLAHTG
jgi:Protein of unknown function (DUF3429)